MYSSDDIRRKIDRESTIDMDWYLVDEGGNIAVIASAGGLLPTFIADNLAEYKSVISYFRSLPVVSNQIKLAPVVEKRVKELKGSKKDAYVRELKFMSTKGLFYFDKLREDNYFDFRYILKSSPQISLNVKDIDQSIAQVVNRAQIKGNFRNLAEIMVDSLE